MASKMLPTGTFSICALSRSTSTKSCGVPAEKVVNTSRDPGRLVGRGDELLGDRPNSAGPRLARSCRRMEKPAVRPCRAPAAG